MTVRSRFVLVLVLVFVAAAALDAQAHCDTLNGPVVSAARAALRTNDVTPVLKWVKESEETEVREAFQKAVTVRAGNAAARELADQFFFETVVRLHRFGEGEPYTGLKPATEVDAAIETADRALEAGTAQPVVTLIGDRVAAGLRERFARVLVLREHADENVAAGRRYVAAYVEFIHFVEETNALGSASGESHR